MSADCFAGLLAGLLVCIFVLFVVCVSCVSLWCGLAELGRDLIFLCDTDTYIFCLFFFLPFTCSSLSIILFVCCFGLCCD